MNDASVAGIVTEADSFPTSTEGLPSASRPTLVELADGDAFDLEITPVTKTIDGSIVRMLAYNGTIPGPTLKVSEGSRLTVRATNNADLEATVHWHGLRLENRYDGTHETQAPIPIGATFVYELAFPDPGVYWYHPHIREDYAQEMGLYGNVLVAPSGSDYWPPVDREFLLTLDDVLIEDGRIARFSPRETTFVAMGRFGNVFLVSGEPELSLSVLRGEVARFYLTNTANTRVFNVTLPGVRMKLVGGDSGHYEREEFVEAVLIAPSERVVVDVLFDDPGVLTLLHRTPGGDYPLATIAVSEHAAGSSSAAGDFDILRENEDLTRERERLKRYLTAAPDKTLAFVAEMDTGAPDGEGHHEHGHGHHAGDSTHNPARGIEWEDGMIDVNRTTTPANMLWKLIDRSTGAENNEIEWRFRVGDQVKIRLVNEMDSDHPMPHPFHIHGAGRFLILSRDGVTEPNLVWKDTVLVRTGETVDLLLDATNAGVWMAHCHIAEHHEGGMMFSFRVDGGE